MFFLVSLLLAVCEAQNFYAIRDLSNSAKEALILNGHFYGTYGKALSVVSELPQDSLNKDVEVLEVTGTGPYALYVFELRSSEGVSQVKQFLSSYSHYQMVYSSSYESIIQILNLNNDMPDFALTAIHRENFPSIENIISIPPTPYQPATHYTYPTVTAPNPKIVAVLDLVETSFLNQTITRLSDFHTRNSFSTESREAGEYIRRLMVDYNATVTTNQFNSSMCSNIIATFRGTLTSPTVIVGAHYDSRAAGVNNATQRAPGAVDNGSGSAGLIAVARAISQSRVSFRYPVQLQFFCGEEQGLLGSRAQARLWNSSTARCMLNGDMFGYALASATPTTLTQGFKDRYVSRSLTDLMMSVTREYTTLRTANSSSCCSDYQSYHEQGIDAAGFFQNQGAASDFPAYHTADDLPKWVNWTQQTLETKAFLAGILTVAEVV